MESVIEKADLLRRSILVYGLSLEQIQTVAELAKKESFTAGEHITLLGAREADLFVIIDGHVNVLTHDSDKLAEVGPGGILGEISFVDAGPRHAHCVASGFTTTLRFEARALRHLMATDKNIGFTMLANLSRLLASRLRHANGRLDALMDIEHNVWQNAL